MSLSGHTMQRTHHPSVLKQHRTLVFFAVLAVAYCLGAPVLGNLVAHMMH